MPYVSRLDHHHMPAVVSVCGFAFHRKAPALPPTAHTRQPDIPAALLQPPSSSSLPVPTEGGETGHAAAHSGPGGCQQPQADQSLAGQAWPAAAKLRLPLLLPCWRKDDGFDPPANPPTSLLSSGFMEPLGFLSCHEKRPKSDKMFTWLQELEQVGSALRWAERAWDSLSLPSHPTHWRARAFSHPAARSTLLPRCLRGRWAAPTFPASPLHPPKATRPGASCGHHSPSPRPAPGQRLLPSPATPHARVALAVPIHSSTHGYWRD